MKFNEKLVEWAGQLFCSGIMDIVSEKKMPQVVFKLDQGSVKQIRWVMLDNRKVEMSKEEIQNRMSALKAAPGKDVGFSYTKDGIRVIVVPEDMSIFPVVGAPLGTPMG